MKHLKFKWLLVFYLLLVFSFSLQALPNRSTLFSVGESFSMRLASGFEVADLNGDSGQYDFVVVDRTASDNKIQVWCRNIFDNPNSI